MNPTLLSSVTYGIVAVDRALRYVYVNPAALDMMQMRRDDVIGRTPDEIFPAPLAVEVSARVRQVLDTAQPLTYDVYYDALDRWYENRLFPWADGVAAFFIDITPRKQAEEVLRASEARQRELAAALRESRDMLSLAMRGGRMGAWSRHIGSDEVWWSRELEEIFGLPPGGFSGTRGGYFEFVHPDDRARLEEAVASAIRARTDYVVEFRFRHASGEWRWMEGRGTATYDAEGRPVALHGVGIDITARKQAERSVADARAAAAADAAHLNIALAAARLGDWRWDVATDVVTMSARGAEIFGIPAGPHMTWTAMRELLHPDDRERVREAVERAIATHSDYTTEYRLINRGRERWVSASGRARYAEDGRPTGMMGVVQDISHDRMLVRLDDAVRPLSSADDIAFTSATFLGSHLGVNRCAYAVVEEDEDTFVLTGNYTHGSQSIVGRYRFSAFGAECHRLMRAGQPYVVEDARRDPRITPEDRRAYEATAIAAVICVPILKSRRFVAAMAVHTIAPRAWTSDQVAVVQQVASRCWESLERARVERERALLLERAEAANRAKDEFLAMLGHELRNPLSPILTALQLMQMRGDDATRRERHVIERQVAHLTRLVDDLLDVARIARGKVELKRDVLEMADVLARAVETASPLLEERMHTLTIDAPPAAAVFGDVARLTQVFANLLTNAAKYTPHGGRIAVTVTTEAGEVLVAVRDSGVGITPEMLSHVFEPFIQGPQRLDRAQGGLGLGLTIVRSLVERHGGSVRAASEGPGRGSEFVVRLPLAVQSAPAAPVDVTPAVSRDGRGVRVLVVDDNADAAEMLQLALARRGCDVRVASDGLAALRVADAFRPDVAVLDIGLPVMDGYEVATRLQRIPGLESVRLIAVTGYGQTSDRQRSARAGFHEHLVKPVDIDALLQLVAAARASNDAS